MTTSTISPSVSRRISVTLFVTQSLYGASQIASFTLIPIIAAALYGDESLAGLPLTLAFMTRAGSAYPFGWVMDRFGRRPGLMLGYLTVVLGSAVAVIAIADGSFLWFCLGVGLAGAGRSAAEQTRFVAAEAYPIDQRAKVIGAIVFAGTVGAIGGPLLVAPSADWIAPFGLPPNAGPFVMAVILCTVAIALIFLLLRPDPLTLARQQTADHLEETTNRMKRSLGEIFALPTVRYAMTAMVIGQLVMTLLMVITPLHMNHHQHSTQTISLVIMAHAMGMFGLSGLTGRLIIRWGQENVVRLGVLVLTVSSVMTPISPEFMPTAVALFLLGLGWNFCFIAGSSLLSNALGTEEKGRVQGASEMLIAVSASLGSIGTGVAFGQGGIITVAAIGLAASGLLGVYSMLFARMTVSKAVARRTA